jgi:hypothetical protein
MVRNSSEYLVICSVKEQIQSGSNMTWTDLQLPNTYLHMSVFNVLPSGVNTFFPTFWKHPDALKKKRLLVGGIYTPEQSG